MFCPYCGAKQTDDAVQPAASQPVNQPVSQPVNQPVSQPVNQPVSQPVYHTAPGASVRSYEPAPAAPVRSYEPAPGASVRSYEPAPAAPAQGGYDTAGGYATPVPPVGQAAPAKPKGRKLWLLAIPVALIALAVFFLTRPIYSLSHEAWLVVEDGETERFFSRDYNEDNLIVSQTEYESMGLGQRTYYYEYDDQGRMTAKYWGGKSDPDCVDYFEYDSDGCLTRMVEKTPGWDDDYIEERINLTKQGSGYTATLRETDDDDPLTNEYTVNNNIIVREHYYNDVCDINIISDERNVMISKSARYSDSRSAYSFDEQYDANHILTAWTISRDYDEYTFNFTPVEKDSHGNVTAVEARFEEVDDAVVRVVYEYRSETRFSKLFG